MKSIKILITCLLLGISIIVLSTLLNGTTVTIEGKGRGETVYNDDGTWTYRCIPDIVTTCSLKITLPKD